MNDPMIKCFIKAFAFVPQHSLHQLDSAALQDFEGLASMPRIWISCADNYLLDPCCDNRFRAWRCPTVCGARFERDVKSCALGFRAPFFAVSKCFDFGMAPAGMVMPTSPNDFTGVHRNCSHHWIGGSRAISAAGQAQGQTHIIRIRWHTSFAKEV